MKAIKNLTIIAAIGKNYELGKDNNLIWRFHEDMKFFRENTMGKSMIMGRKTLESLPKLLPGREHLVLSSQKLDIPGVKFYHTKEELLEYIPYSPKDFMVIGGASIYEQFIDFSNTMLLTEIDAECKDADVYFPKIDEEEWERSIISCENENNINYKHVLYKRRK